MSVKALHPSITVSAGQRQGAHDADCAPCNQHASGRWMVLRRTACLYNGPGYGNFFPCRYTGAWAWQTTTACSDILPQIALIRQRVGACIPGVVT